MASSIKNFEELMKPILKKGQKFKSYTCKRFLNSGENYGSVMLKVDVEITNENGEDEVLHCVAKTCPPKGPVWEIFRTKLTFKMEIALYEEIVPALNEFGKERGIECLIDFFGKCLGARISADPTSDTVDEDAVLLLENLREQGFVVGNRFVGFDIETTKLLLNDMAVWHATAIAYRRSKPDEFSQKILPHLTAKFKMHVPQEVIAEVIDFATKCVKKNPECRPHSSQIKKALQSLSVQSNYMKGNEHFRSLTHNDYWVNNTMVRYENGKPIQNRMLDFQALDCSSLGHDVIYFLYSSVEISVLENHIDELYGFYYEKFIETLIKLQFDVSEYSFEDMMVECGVAAKEVQFGHLILIMIPIMTSMGGTIDLNEDNYVFCKEDKIHDNYEKKVQFMLLDFLKRKWI